jgi:hypothetical protein
MNMNMNMNMNIKPSSNTTPRVNTNHIITIGKQELTAARSELGAFCR